MTCDVLATALFHSFSHQATLPEASGANQHQVISALYKLLNIGDLIYPVGEVLCLYNGAEFKRVLHITFFFVTTFFVVTAKVMFYLYPAKFLGPKMTERFDSLSIVRFFQVGL